MRRGAVDGISRWAVAAVHGAAVPFLTVSNGNLASAPRPSGAIVLDTAGGVRLAHRRPDC